MRGFGQERASDIAALNNRGCPGSTAQSLLVSDSLGVVLSAQLKTSCRLDACLTPAFNRD